MYGKAVSFDEQAIKATTGRDGATKRRRDIECGTRRGGHEVSPGGEL